MDVMRHLRRVGHIRPVEAGLILYAHTEPSEAAVDRRARYASSDGSEMLRRMAKRGLVRWVSRGRWEAGPGEPPAPRRSEMMSASGGFAVPSPTVFATIAKGMQQQASVSFERTSFVAAFRVSLAAASKGTGGG